MTTYVVIVDFIIDNMASYMNETYVAYMGHFLSNGIDIASMFIVMSNSGNRVKDKKENKHKMSI